MHVRDVEYLADFLDRLVSIQQAEVELNRKQRRPELDAHQGVGVSQ